MERANAQLDVIHRLLTADLPPLIGPARRDELLDRLDDVRSRVAGPDLRLVVLGEFSSGKTSLINAFLREEILPASARESTAVPTEIHAGHRFSLHLLLEPGGRWLNADEDRPIWRTRLPELSEVDVRAMPAALTADTAVADRVYALRVTHPARALGPGVVIIDTPGIAGHDDRRTERTIEVVNDRADLVLVVVPANAAFSRTLTDLLTGPLGEHRDRFLFVVTKVDQIDPDERTRFVRSVHRSLTAELDVPASPLVFTVAPAVLPGRRAAGDIDWAAGFADAEDFLRVHLAERRSAPVAAPDRGPVADLLQAVDQEIGRVRQDVRTLLSRAAEVPGLDAVLDRLAALGSAARDDTAAWITAASTTVAPADRGTAVAVHRQRDALIAHTAELAYAVAGGPPEWCGPYVGVAVDDRPAARADALVARARGVLCGVEDACARYLSAVHRSSRRRLADLRTCDAWLAGWRADLAHRIESIRSEPEGS